MSRCRQAKIHRRSLERIVLVVGTLLAPVGAIRACGFGFPNRILLEGDALVLSMPHGDLAFEIERLLPEGSRIRIPDDLKLGMDDPRKATASADIDDLEEALTLARVPEARKSAVLGATRTFRETLQALAALEDSWKPREVAAAAGDLAVPDGLPAEFADYLRGAVAYHRGSFEEARRHWRGLLALPAAERRYRSTWAAFMIGKAWLGTEPDRAVEAFRRTRELAAEGFADRLGLEAASYGWEARAELARGNAVVAIRLYLTQLALGQRDAFSSLRLLSRATVREGGAALERMASDPEARSVVTAYLLCTTEWHDGRRTLASAPIRAWLDAAARARVADFAGADRLAWLAYAAGDVEAARGWLAHAPGDSSVTIWVRARLALRSGRLDEAARLLSRVVRTLPQERKWRSLPVDDFHQMDFHTSAGRALGELGTLKLARRQFTEALDALLRAGYWVDAAYVAEQVLTDRELETYVDREWAQPAPPTYLPTSHKWWDLGGESRGLELRYLLGRRLARQGRYSDARPYFPRSLQKTLDDYARVLEGGKDRRRTAAERAESFWEAATIARHSGMEILGTELDPDWAVYGGSFDLGSARAARERDSGKILPPSAEERSRGKAHAVEPYERFHYRYIAGRHAIEAVNLLPENSDRAARMLCIAGSWLKKRDPQAADRFYKLLVRRCAQTELGKEAARLRWFPKIEETP